MSFLPACDGINELDVDFIGGQGPLTKDEEIAISEYIRNERAMHEMHPKKINVSQAGRTKQLHN